jgi:hypothetical protein
LFPVNFQWKQQSQELRILSTVIFQYGFPV